MVSMHIFKGHGKQPEKPGKKQMTEQKANGKKHAPGIPQEEMQHARAMAQRLAEVESFAEFCAKNQLGNPAKPSSASMPQ